MPDGFEANSGTPQSPVCQRQARPDKKTKKGSENEQFTGNKRAVHGV